MIATETSASAAAPRRKRDRKGERERIRANKVRLKSLDQLDGRTIAAARARQIVQRIESDLGGGSNLTEGAKQLVQRAAILAVVIESDEMSWLQGSVVDLANYFTAVNVQRRILVTLGLERDPLRAKVVTALDDMFVEAEEAAAE
jgi:hypothetical protein